MKVEISEELEDLIPGYLSNKSKEVEKMKTALQNKEFDVIRTIGHGMKGSGGGYGFDYITEVGHKIEVAGKEEDGSVLPSLFSELQNYIEKVDITYI